jgi:hypothetical protein
MKKRKKIRNRRSKNCEKWNMKKKKQMQIMKRMNKKREKWNMRRGRRRRRRCA